MLDILQRGYSVNLVVLFGAHVAPTFPSLCSLYGRLYHVFFHVLCAFPTVLWTLSPSTDRVRSLSFWSLGPKHDGAYAGPGRHVRGQPARIPLVHHDGGL